MWADLCPNENSQNWVCSCKEINFALLFPRILFCFPFHMAVVFLTFIKRTRTDPMFVLKWTALNLSCFWALGLMPHRLDGQIDSLQTSCLRKLCVQLACNVTALSGYYQKIGCLEEDESSTADFLQQYCRKILAVFLISREMFFSWAPFVNHIILIPAALLSNNNAGSFSRVIFKIQIRQ